MLKDIEEERAKTKKNLIDIKKQLLENGLSKQEIKELKRKRKAIAKDMIVLEKAYILENRNIKGENGNNRKRTLNSTRRKSNSKVIGYLLFQFIFIIFQIVYFNITISALAIFFSIVFCITSILAVILSHKTTTPMWSENKENFEKLQFLIIILLTIFNLLIGVAILLFS